MSDSEQNFEALKKLLKLKQHEVPPPGYFDSFSSKVIARLEAGEAVRNAPFYEQIQAHAPWLARFIAIFESRGSLIGMSAAGLCLFVMAGVVINDKTDRTEANGLVADTQSFSAPVSPLPMTVASAQPLLADVGGGIQIATNPVSLQPVTAMFGQPGAIFQPQRIQASFPTDH